VALLEKNIVSFFASSNYCAFSLYFMAHTLEHLPTSSNHHPDSSAFLDDMVALDTELSNRHIDLDPAGYFLIYLDRENHLICAALYSNDINDKGIAVDPDTGKPIPCNRPVKRTPVTVFTGRTAKELGMKITEQATPCPVTRFDHALYLGREFVRAEMALISGEDYIQD
jgi:dihydropteroate synthase